MTSKITKNTPECTKAKATERTPQSRILILGGTTEANQLADQLSQNPIYHVTTSRAGVTTNRKKVSGNERIGGFGGIEGLCEYLEVHAIDVVIDATHPFAATITDHAWIACQRLEIPHLVLQRPAWKKEENDAWIDVPDMQAAQDYLQSLDTSLTILLTTGQKELNSFTSITKHHFVARMIEPPAPETETKAEKQNLKVILQRGPFSVDEETRLIKEEQIDFLISKNSGGTATSAKLIAARKHNVPVLMIARPPQPPAMIISTIEDCLNWLQNHFSNKQVHKR
ncbi:cobalt-precorrin-6A reductase [Kiloniella majae]|uniref:cobalt-precorrin-6A reductase n=1 Tax=Kiloniella majae TaxID=1938558 RepID=UPI000A279130|nr:cobalt-precorrin-6A reductase [Kiloniella majae]